MSARQFSVSGIPAEALAANAVAGVISAKESAEANQEEGAEEQPEGVVDGAEAPADAEGKEQEAPVQEA